MRVWFGVDHNKAGKGTTCYMSDKLVDVSHTGHVREFVEELTFLTT